MKTMVKDNAQFYHQLAWAAQDVEDLAKKQAVTDPSLSRSGIIKEITKLNEIIQQICLSAMGQEDYEPGYADENGVCVAMEQKTGISDPVYVCLLMGCSSVTSRSYRKFHQQNIK